jgi:hypothetical protein
LYGFIAGPQVAGSTSCDCNTGLRRDGLILGLIIWLFILTILVVALVILLTRRRSEHRSSIAKRDSFRTLPRNSESPWIDAMREDTWKEYSVETISNR